MSAYDLRSLFPYGEREFGSTQGTWICRLAEVSDQRPDVDRLSWYLVFERGQGNFSREDPQIRKLEIVTGAEKVVAAGLGPEVEQEIANWVSGDAQDGRIDLAS